MHLGQEILSTVHVSIYNYGDTYGMFVVYSHSVVLSVQLQSFANGGDPNVFVKVIPPHNTACTSCFPWLPLALCSIIKVTIIIPPLPFLPSWRENRGDALTVDYGRCSKDIKLTNIPTAQLVTGL